MHFQLIFVNEAVFSSGYLICPHTLSPSTPSWCSFCSYAGCCLVLHSIIRVLFFSLETSKQSVMIYLTALQLPPQNSPQIYHLLMILAWSNHYLKCLLNSDLPALSLPAYSPITCRYSTVNKSPPLLSVYLSNLQAWLLNP